MTDKKKLHQILSSLWKNDDSVGKTYYNQALQDVQTAIDLQEEPVSEELEEAAKRYGTKKHPMSKIGTNESACNFKAGANWQREKMMKDAVDGEVVKDIANNLYIGKAKVNKNNFKFGDKVKLLVLKEE